MYCSASPRPDGEGAGRQGCTCIDERLLGNCSNALISKSSKACHCRRTQATTGSNGYLGGARGKGKKKDVSFWVPQLRIVAPLIDHPGDWAGLLEGSRRSIQGPDARNAQRPTPACSTCNWRPRCILADRQPCRKPKPSDHREAIVQCIVQPQQVLNRWGVTRKQVCRADCDLGVITTVED